MKHRGFKVGLHRYLGKPPSDQRKSRLIGGRQERQSETARQPNRKDAKSAKIFYSLLLNCSTVLPDLSGGHGLTRISTRH